MANSTKFTVDGLEFLLVNHPGGTEEIFVGEVLVSKAKSLMGGTHEFSHDADDYIIKVKGGLTGVALDIKKNGVTQDDGREKLPTVAYLVCGWPLALVAVGGAIGGGLGGAAMGANFAIYRSELPLILKVVLNLATGAAAFALWLLAVKALR